MRLRYGIMVLLLAGACSGPTQVSPEPSWAGHAWYGDAYGPGLPSWANVLVTVDLVVLNGWIRVEPYRVEETELRGSYQYGSHRYTLEMSFTVEADTMRGSVWLLPVDWTAERPDHRFWAARIP